MTERIEALKATLKFAKQMWADHMMLGQQDTITTAFMIVEKMIEEAEGGQADPVQFGFDYLKHHGVVVIASVSAKEVIEKTMDLHEVSIDDPPGFAEAVKAIDVASDALWEQGLPEIVKDVVNACDELYGALFGAGVP